MRQALGSARRMIGLLRRLNGPARGAALRRAAESDGARLERLQQALQAPPNGLLFICHGNIMRSAFAVAVARDLVARSNPERVPQVHGAGTNARAGSPAEPSALRAAHALGLPLTDHSATPLASLTPGTSELVICMDRANEASSMVWAGASERRVFLVGDIAAVRPASRLEAGGLHADEGQGDRVVRDPYGRGDEATARAFAQVRAYVQAWVGELTTGSR